MSSKQFQFKDLDFFPKVCKDHSRQTSFSGTVTVICLLIMLYMGTFQSIKYFTTPKRQRLTVDQSRLPQDQYGLLQWDEIPMLPIYLDVFFPNLSCSIIDFHVHDMFKEKQITTNSSIKFKRIGPDGKIIKLKPQIPAETCGSCYGASSGCCNTCSDVKKAFKLKKKTMPPLSSIKQCRNNILSYENIKNEKCHIYGRMLVPPMHGTIVISTGDSFDPTTNSSSFLNINMDDFNFSYTINSFYIGDKDDGDHPLNDYQYVQTQKGRYKGVFYIKTLREYKDSSLIYRTTATHYSRFRDQMGSKFPGLFFHYDISPIIVQYKKDVSVLHFFVDLMAILGGVFSIGSMLDHISVLRVRKLPQALS